MAKRRMFSLEVVDTDRFLDLPLTAQALYFHLGMRADDDGFVGSPKRTATICGASTDDMQRLIDGGYLLHFQSGICVITDWKRSNSVKADRYTPTQYQEEFSKLKIGTDGRYSLDPIWRQVVSKLEPQVRIEEVSRDEEKKGQVIQEEDRGFLEEGCQGGTSLGFSLKPIKTNAEKDAEIMRMAQAAIKGGYF